MASQKSYAVNTGLDALPDPSAVPAKLYDLFVTIYNTVHSLAEGLAGSYGLEDRVPAQYSDMIGEDKRFTHRYDTLSTIELEAAEAFTYAQAVKIGSDGKAYLSDTGAYLGGYWSCPMLGFSSGEVAVGETCKVFTKGIIGADNAIYGHIYGRLGYPGYEGVITTGPNVGILHPSYGPGAYSTCVHSGQAITDSVILVESILP